jgi:hypothetical protein
MGVDSALKGVGQCKVVLALCSQDRRGVVNVVKVIDTLLHCDFIYWWQEPHFRGWEEALADIFVYVCQALYTTNLQLAALHSSSFVEATSTDLISLISNQHHDRGPLEN